MALYTCIIKFVQHILSRVDQQTPTVKKAIEMTVESYNFIRKIRRTTFYLRSGAMIYGLLYIYRYLSKIYS